MGYNEGVNCIAGYIYFFFALLDIRLMYDNHQKYKNSDEKTKSMLCCPRIFPYISMLGLISKVVKSIKVAFTGVTLEESVWFDTNGYNLALGGHMMLMSIYCFRSRILKRIKLITISINLSLLVIRLIVSSIDSAVNGTEKVTATAIVTYCCHVLTLGWLTSLWILVWVKNTSEEGKIHIKVFRSEERRVGKE